ncbi:hypothetical protein [Metallosphaera javensis (ex Sakai et al. 2022)]|uniref:hypothetical protein n=1 Tax=Metallosphaera javensis (ex Sakai et al. 2022) TaxID=2775498 RepID=UPI002584CE81
MGNDAALLDCDIPSPTFRRYDILSNEENQHAYLTPNYSKPTEEINPEMYENIIDLNLAAVIEKGIIVMDGLGKHSRLTDALIKRSKALIVLSKHNLTQDEMKSSNYVINGNPTHPFTFYRGALRITTYT